MEYVVFRPYWNPPPSIIRGEVLPALRKDATCLARQDMEIVASGRDRPTRSAWRSSSSPTPRTSTCTARRRIDAAMQGDRTLQANLKDKLAVVVFYDTVHVNSEQVVFFVDDIYGHDRRSDAAWHTIP